GHERQGRAIVGKNSMPQENCALPRPPGIFAWKREGPLRPSSTSSWHLKLWAKTQSGRKFLTRTRGATKFYTKLRGPWIFAYKPGGPKIFRTSSNSKHHKILCTQFPSATPFRPGAQRAVQISAKTPSGTEIARVTSGRHEILHGNYIRHEVLRPNS